MRLNWLDGRLAMLIRWELHLRAHAHFKMFYRAVSGACVFPGAAFVYMLLLPL